MDAGNSKFVADEEANTSMGKEKQKLDFGISSDLLGRAVSN